MTMLLKGSCLLIAPLALALSGCSMEFKEARLRGECTKTDSGGECKIEGEVRWGPPPPPMDPESLMPSILANATLPDAALHVLDVSSSTIPIPTSGTMTVRLVDSRSGKIVASQMFAWEGIRGRIRAKDPNAINDWAYRNLGTADTLKYELTKFHSAYGSGPQRISGTSTYEGVPVAGFSSQFYGGPACTTYPSPHLCQEK